MVTPLHSFEMHVHVLLHARAVSGTEAPLSALAVPSALQDSPVRIRNRLSPEVHKKLGRSRSAQAHTGIAKEEELTEKGSDEGKYKRPGKV